MKTKNIYYDFNSGKCPGIEIIFEFKKEEEKFFYKNNYDKKKQKKITDKFKETIQNQVDKNLPIMFWYSGKEKYKTKNVFVCFSNFETVAKIEANSNVSNEEIEELKKKINNSDLWTISHLFEGVTFFLYTNKQLNNYKNSDECIKWGNLYFEILKKYDEFSYYKRENFSVELDSKENFDKHYQGNWYYYYK